MSISNTNLSIFDINKVFSIAETVFFIGVGGVSMSAIAKFCALCGKKILGYDRARTQLTEELEKYGEIRYYSTPDNVRGSDLVVYTNAIDENNHEYKEAKRLGLPLISRANLLGYLVSLHKFSCGVSGMHGKSTTTAMLGKIFWDAHKNPTVFCGGQMQDFHSNFQFGGRECCIFEACEYQNSFLSLPCTDAMVLNIDNEHLDFFGTQEEIIASFQSYIKNARRVYLNRDDPLSRHLIHRCAITFGLEEGSTYRGEMCADGKTKVYKCGELISHFSLQQAGKHNVYNALGAFAVAYTMGISARVIEKSLSSFSGVAGRMGFLKKNDTGADVFEDYAHHPTEIEASLSTLKGRYGRVMCVFQPHTFSRTFHLYPRFIKALSLADELIIAPTFSAREENVFGVSEENLALDCDGEFVADIEKIAHRVASSTCGCVVLMGAGDLSQRVKAIIL